MAIIRDEKLPESPLAKAGIISKLFLWWLNPIFATGWKRELDLPDLYQTMPTDKPKTLGDRLSQEWANELEKFQKSAAPRGKLEPKRGKPKVYRPSLGKAITRQFGWDYVTFGILLFVEECGIRIAQPVCLGYLINYFNDSEGNRQDSYQGIIFAAAIVGLSAIQNVTHHPYYLGTREIGMRIRISCCSLIYRKTLKLSHSSMGQTNIGQLTNLMSNDVNRYDYSTTFIHYIWIAPLQTLMATYILWGFYGPACLSGLAILGLFVIFEGYCGKLSSTYRASTATKTDKRIRIMNEIVNGIRIIKMYTWEKPFAALVSDSRKDEIKVIRKTSRVLGVNLALLSISGKLTIFLTLMTYILTGNNALTAEKVFVTVALYNTLRWTMTSVLLKAVTQLGEVIVSVRRLETFLLLEERHRADDVGHVSGGIGVKINNFSAKWTSTYSENTLSNLTLSVVEGEMLAVIGTVGCGKSSLLHAILKELPASEGNVVANGKIAYAPQEPWVFAGSIKDNILFGKDFDSSWYDKVVTACALKRDMQLFQFGDNTLVGERGVKLSGGQKARISLARAVYSNADIYLLDDPLSAVDAKVGRDLWENCICGILTNKVRILVTHQLHFLKSIKDLRILLLDGGREKAQGTYAELLQSGVDFTELTSSVEDEEKGDENIPPNDKAFKASSVEDFLQTSQTDTEKKQEKLDGNLNKVTEETRQHGDVDWIYYWKYFRAGSSPITLFFLIPFYILTQVLVSGADWWLSFWTKMHTGNLTLSLNSTDDYEFHDHFHKFFQEPTVQLYTYSGIIATLLIFSVGRTLLTFRICLNSSVNLHDWMFQGLIRAPMRFFEINPIGRLLNRMSKDIGSIDEQMPVAIYDVLDISLLVLGVLVIVAMVNPFVLLPALGIFVVFYYLRGYYLKTAQSVKRLEGVTRSPIFSHLSMSLNGLTTIRAFSAEEEFCRRFDSLQDLHTSAWHVFIASTRWFGIWLDWLSVVFIGVVTFSFLIYSQQAGGTGAEVGLAVSSALMLTGMLQWGVRQSAELENQMVGVERVLEYSKITPEPPLESEPDNAPPENWPMNGEIIMKDVYLNYGDDAPVLKDITCKFNSKDKIGIVGRTGAGKTSLITTLFRLAEPSGIIEIDGVNILEIGLHDLRSKISIIPQDPVLFNGTLRKNLDPFDNYKDEEIWRILEEIQLAQEIKQTPAGLSMDVSEGGANFSVGQRQLLCLGRAILRQNKILVMDEATASLDNGTDALIQRTIRTKFQDCTVLTVAHRLHTVMDSDKILVLDAGSVKEYDNPHILLQDPSSTLFFLVEQTGPSTSDLLKKIAKEAYFNKRNDEDEEGE